MVIDDTQILPPGPETVPERGRPLTTVLGLGRAGGRVTRALAALPSTAPLKLGAADTDADNLAECTGVQTLLLGEDWTGRAGCGGDIAVGERAAGGSADRLAAFMRGADRLFIVAGLGGGTGSGACRVAARLVRDMQLPAFFVLTLPFSFEGNWRRTQADAALGELRSLVDVAVPVPNDLLFSVLPADTPAAKAFAEADRVLAEGIAGLACLMSAEPLIALDFARFRAALREHPVLCGIGVGRGRGPERWRRALEGVFEAPLSGGRKAFEKADGAIVALIGGPDLAMGEVQTCLQEFQRACRPSARILAGAAADASFGDAVLLAAIHFTSTAPKTTPADPGEDLQARPTPSGKHPQRGGRRRRSTASASELQGELPLQERTLGMFAGCPPTTYRGDNLDIPTFQRRGIILDTGD
ncbi:MAG: hypothetical protein GXP31_14760 [Kiritimatiellaeota bacterium]|nr:hypothetical protein [Kiritimatiellota bacterium]